MNDSKSYLQIEILDKIIGDNETVRSVTGKVYKVQFCFLTEVLLKSVDTGEFIVVDNQEFKSMVRIANVKIEGFNDKRKLQGEELAKAVYSLSEKDYIFWLKLEFDADGKRYLSIEQVSLPIYIGYYGYRVGLGFYSKREALKRAKEWNASSVIESQGSQQYQYGGGMGFYEAVFSPSRIYDAIRLSRYRTLTIAKEKGYNIASDLYEPKLEQLDLESNKNEKASKIKSDFVQWRLDSFYSSLKEQEYKNQWWEMRTEEYKEDYIENIKANAVKYIEGFLTAVNDKNLERLYDFLNPANKKTRKYFEFYTGVKLPKTLKGTKRVLEEWVGAEKVKELEVKKEKERKEKEKEKLQNMIDIAKNDLKRKRYNVGGKGRNAKIVNAKEWLDDLLERHNYKIEIVKLGVVPIARVYVDENKFHSFREKNELVYLRYISDLVEMKEKYGLTESIRELSELSLVDLQRLVDSKKEIDLKDISSRREVELVIQSLDYSNFCVLMVKNGLVHNNLIRDRIYYNIVKYNDIQKEQLSVRYEGKTIAEIIEEAVLSPSEYEIRKSEQVLYHFENEISVNKIPIDLWGIKYYEVLSDAYREFYENIRVGMELFNLESTGILYYDRMLTVPTFYKDNKREIGILTYISPRKFFDLCSSFCNVSADDIRDFSDFSLVKQYQEMMSKGDKFPVPVVDMKSKNFEGRHRALAVEGLGVNLMPVLIVYDIDDYDARCKKFLSDNLFACKSELLATLVDKMIIVNGNNSSSFSLQVGRVNIEITDSITDDLFNVVVIVDDVKMDIKKVYCVYLKSDRIFYPKVIVKDFEIKFVDVSTFKVYEGIKSFERDIKGYFETIDNLFSKDYKTEYQQVNVEFDTKKSVEKMKRKNDIYS